jgi:hypothetical protein
MKRALAVLVVVLVTLTAARSASAEGSCNSLPISGCCRALVPIQIDLLIDFMRPSTGSQSYGGL